MTVRKSVARKPRMRVAKKDAAKCLLCPRPASARGLCVNCHCEARRTLREQEEGPERDKLEQQMIDKGLLLPRTKPGPRSENPFRKRFEEVIGQK